MKSIILASTALMVTIAFAATAEENEIIVKRQDAMMTLGKSMKTLTPMAKGEADFDPALALEALSQINAVAGEMSTMFPEDSKTGTGHSHHGIPKETEASPKIWEDPDGFQAEIDSFVVSAGNIVSAPPSDLFELEEAVGTLGKHCKSCHEGYRIKKD